LRASNRRESLSSQVKQYIITGTAAGSSTKQQTTQLVFAEDDTKEQVSVENSDSYECIQCNQSCTRTTDVHVFVCGACDVDTYWKEPIQE
jgi:ribosomal protein L37AE/L43A